jgi:phenylalanyl-tRNA synthetase beta chain
MLETGQPLHAFDGDKLENRKIIIRFAKDGEKITTLDGQKFNLDSDVLVIADAKSPVGIAGVKGGKSPEIDGKTKIVVLEAANFNPQVIRQGSRKLNLKTDASLRFEHGIDPNLTEFAINRAAFLIQEIAKGKVSQGLIDIYPKKALPKIIKLDLNYLKSLLGIEIPKTKAIAVLKKLEFNIQHSTFNILTVKVPTFRLDVSLPEDLTEEIGRIYGYDKIPSVFPAGILVPPKRNLDIFWENIAKNTLKESGLTEVYNYSFISEKDATTFSFGKSSLAELENPISDEQRYLRPSLIPNLLKDVQRNQKQFSEIKIFELGKIFRKQTAEKRMLTAAMTGDKFYQLKGVIDTLLNKFCISNIWFDSYQPTPEQSKISCWNYKRCAEIKVDAKEIGFLGEISQKISNALKIPKVTVFDLNFEILSKLCSEEQEYRPISRFPAAVRDVAVLVPREIRVEEVLNEMERAGGGLIRDIDLFDIYEGEEIPGGKKNLAFHVVFQAEDRTLKSEEIDRIQRKIIKTLEKNPEWQVRK